jgi:hypothetical protein
MAKFDTDGKLKYLKFAVGKNFGWKEITELESIR